MVLRAGENVYCAEVESAIYDHPDVYEAAVFGVPHERLGEEVACVVHRQPGSTLTGDQLQGLPGQPAGPVQDPHPHRLQRRAPAPQPVGQDPQTGAARELLRRGPLAARRHVGPGLTGRAAGRGLVLNAGGAACPRGPGGRRSSCRPG